MPIASSVRPQPAVVEQPQHRLLAVHGRIGRAAQIEALILDRRAEAAVLRQPVLGDVHAGEHLDARDQRRRQLDRQQRDVAERAVDAEADAEVVLPRLEMDVARAFLRGAADHALEHRHGGTLRRLVALQPLRRDRLDPDRAGAVLRRATAPTRRGSSDRSPRRSRLRARARSGSRSRRRSADRRARSGSSGSPAPPSASSPPSAAGTRCGGAPLSPAARCSASVLTVKALMRTVGTPICRLSASSTASAVTNPSSTSTWPSRRPVCCCRAMAAWSCGSVSSPRSQSSAPSAFGPSTCRDRVACRTSGRTVRAAGSPRADRALAAALIPEGDSDATDLTTRARATPLVGRT